jgi:DUF4097 and DUF4098 domain-containing protein YvlB
MRPEKTVFAAFLCVVLLSGCINQFGISGERRESEEIFESTVSAVELSLEIVAHNGYIEVQLWEKSSYRIEVTKWARASSGEEAQKIADNLRVDFKERTGAEVVLELDVEQKNNTGTEITVYLPSVSFNTIDLGTSNGYISILDTLTANEVSLESSNGYITGSLSADEITVTTSNGMVSGSFMGEDVVIKTSNGRVDIDCGNGTYTIETSNGSVDVRTGDSGSYDMSTSNGSITVTAPGDFSFDLRSSNAVIDVAVPLVTYTVNTRDHKKGYTTDDAPISIYAETSNGSITVKD